MRLFDGQRYRRCCGMRMDRRNGGRNLMYLRTLKCLSNYKMLDGECDMLHIVEMDFKKVFLLPFTMSWLVGKSIVTDAYVFLFSMLTIGRTHVSSDEILVEKRTFYSFIHGVSQIQHQRSFKVYYHGLHRNLLFVLL